MNAKLTKLAAFTALLCAVLMVALHPEHDPRPAAALLTLMAIAFLPVAAVCGITPGAKPPQVKLESTASAEFDPQTFIRDVETLRGQANSMLAGLPPLEQFEAAPELAYAFRCLTSVANNLSDLLQGVRAKIEKYQESVRAEADAGAAAKLIEGGEYIKRSDADAAATAAADKREQDVRATIQQEAAARAEIATKRAKLVEDKVVASATIADALPDDFFKPEGYEGRLASLKARLGKLTENKLTSEPFVAEMVAIPLDENGEKTFEARLASTKSLFASASRGGSNGNTQPPPPAVPPGGIGASASRSDANESQEVEAFF